MTRKKTSTLRPFNRKRGWSVTTIPDGICTIFNSGKKVLFDQSGHLMAFLMSKQLNTIAATPVCGVGNTGDRYRTTCSITDAVVDPIKQCDRHSPTAQRNNLCAATIIEACPAPEYRDQLTSFEPLIFIKQSMGITDRHRTLPAGLIQQFKYAIHPCP